MSKSVKDIADKVVRTMEQVIKNELPTPDCPLKKQHNEWKRKQVREDVAGRLNPDAAPLTIKIGI